MAKKFKIFVKPNGDIEMVYNDHLVPLLPGKKTVTRASNVEFNETDQVWEARYPDGRLMCSDKSRDECLKTEVFVVEGNLQKQLTCPTTESNLMKLQ